MLDDNDIPYRYREYTKDPLSEEEIRTLLAKLGLDAREVLRKRSPDAKKLGLTGEESNKVLVPLMAEHPTLLQRPIGVVGKRAAVGRPVENLLELAGD